MLTPATMRLCPSAALCVHSSTTLLFQGWTPLMSASHQGRAKVVKMFLLEGSNSSVQDKEVRPYCCPLLHAEWPAETT